jgi:hypothetical protein
MGLMAAAKKGGVMIRYSFFRPVAGVDDEGPIHPEDSPMSLQLDSMEGDELRRVIGVLRANGFDLQKYQAADSGGRLPDDA